MAAGGWRAGSRMAVSISSGAVLLAVLLGPWTPSARADEPAAAAGKLTADNPTSQDRFGWSVAVSGDTMVVGAPLAEELGITFAGAVHLFERRTDDANAWTHILKLTAPDAGLNHQFGRSVAIDGDTLVVGAVGDQWLGEFTGSAYIFERNRGGANAWGLVGKLTASPAMRGDSFGESVAISGDTVVVGATQSQAPFPARAGFATVFRRNHLGPDTWGPVARVTASDAQSRGGFGFSVAISGDTAIVGAQGAVGTASYIFDRNRGGQDAWGETTKLSDPGGWSVAISGNTVIIGNPSGSGRAAIFSRDAVTGTWAEVARLNPGETTEPVAFGLSVSISGDTAVVGVPDDDEKGGIGSRSGAAHVYERQPGTNEWRWRDKLTAVDGKRSDQFGHSVAIAGMTAVVGTPMLGAEPGAAYVCDLATLRTTGGACGRAIPIVNSLITMSEMTTACCAGNEFVIAATFTNTSEVPIAAPFFEVTQLGGVAAGNRLQNADGGPGGVGATLTPPLSDGMLSPGESMRVTFVVHLATTTTFWIRVDVRGEPGP